MPDGCSSCPQQVPPSPGAPSGMIVSRSAGTYILGRAAKTPNLFFSTLPKRPAVFELRHVLEHLLSGPPANRMAALI